MTAVSPAYLHGYSFYAPAGEVYQSRFQAPFPPHDSPFYCGDSRPSVDAAASDRGGAAMRRRSF
ncbi:hypothetical protein [Citrifermentans bemidjiense]|uniref:hypothetical protein n=1 Tax=Citrifermentans bemidjiense TaxID=225194 RepID=UPI00031A7806|nr:hypothetical protein [Citrifermentans bemidjiense]